MKKMITMFVVISALFISTHVMSAFAAEDDAPMKNVTITVVMPDKASEPTPKPKTKKSAETKLYPVDVTENFTSNRRQIVKTYELSPLDNPADIPCADFERNNWIYSITDILKCETANAETRDHKETVTLNTDTKELNQILELLAPTIEYTSDDNFVGLLYLDVASIKVETAGTKTTSYEMKVTREYPRLATNDTALVPKTLTENGTTYHLADVNWKAGNYSTVDYERIADYYTAYATYTATGSSTRVTGYVTTAEYVGALAKLSQGKTIYTAYFEGKEIRTPLEMTELPKDEPTANRTEEFAEEFAKENPEEISPEISEQSITELEIKSSGASKEEAIPTTDESDNAPKNIPLYIIIALLSLLLAGGIFYTIKNGKEQITNEKTTDTSADISDVGNDDDTDTGC